MITDNKIAVGIPPKSNHGLYLPYFLLNFFISIILKYTEAMFAIMKVDSILNSPITNFSPTVSGTNHIPMLNAHKIADTIWRILLVFLGSSPKLSVTNMCNGLNSKPIIEPIIPTI